MEIKSWLAKGIRQASEQDPESKTTITVGEQVAPLKKLFMDEVETLLARYIFPGQCPMCPDYEVKEPTRLT